LFFTGPVPARSKRPLGFRSVLMVVLRPERCCRRSLVFPLAAAILYACVATVAAAEPIKVVLDQAKLIRLPERVATVVVGNPLIADASVQPGGMMVVTGKGYGETNLVALDRGGRVLLEQMIQVRGPGEHVVVVYRGVERETYSCNPTCQPRITLGDSRAYFATTLLESTTRNSQAAASAASR
jgi:Pilus formation protein N terminal region